MSSTAAEYIMECRSSGCQIDMSRISATGRKELDFMVPLGYFPTTVGTPSSEHSPLSETLRENFNASDHDDAAFTSHKRGIY